MVWNFWRFRIYIFNFETIFVSTNQNLLRIATQRLPQLLYFLAEENEGFKRIKPTRDGTGKKCRNTPIIIFPARNNSTLSRQIYRLLFLIITVTSLRPTLLRLFHLFRQVSQTFHRPFVLPSAGEGNKRGAESRRGLLSSRPLAESSWPKLRCRCWLVNKIREKFGQEESMQRTRFPRGWGLRAKWKGPLRVIPNTSESSYELVIVSTPGGGRRKINK